MKSGYLRRYYILKIISNPSAFGVESGKHISFLELTDILKNMSKDPDTKDLFKDFCSPKDKNKGISHKTLKRDRDEIKVDFGCEIYSFRGKGFYLKQEIDKQTKSIFNKIEHFLISYKASFSDSNISSENTSLNSNIDFMGLITAIKSGKTISLSYDGWIADNNFHKIENKSYKPLHLKEKEKAWYLIALCLETHKIESFCLDERLTNLKIHDRSLLNNVSFDIDEHFKDSIGILLMDDIDTETITIKVANHHLKYLESKPMHHSQKVLNYPKKENTPIPVNYDDPDIWGEIQIRIKPNYEFIMELLKYNKWIYVTNPTNVVEFVKEYVDEVQKHYTAVKV